MKAVIQRVSSASIVIDQHKISEINYGMLILLGIESEDIRDDLDYLVNKIINLRIFKDINNNMNLSIKDINAETLVVSQFTLCADTRRGRRPSFIKAAKPNIAQDIYDTFCSQLKNKGVAVKKGSFGAMMQVNLINDGPVTILLDSNDR